MNILFVCSRNRWRSPTAEQLFRNYPGIAVRSAGTSPSARKHVSLEDVRWADLFLVMEEKHKSRLVAQFTRLVVADAHNPTRRSGRRRQAARLSFSLGGA